MKYWINTTVNILTNMTSQEGKIAASSTVQHCPKHSDSVITLVCTTCNTLNCELCKPVHIGHNIKPCLNDGKLIQTICRAQTQGFYTVLNNLEEAKDAHGDRETLYKEAKTKIQEKIKYLITKTLEIQTQVEAKLDVACDAARKSETKVEEDIRKVDDCISHLHSVRNIRDVDVLIPQAVDNGFILEQLQQSTGKGGASRATGDIGHIFPNISTLEDQIDELSNVFHVALEVDDYLDESSGFDYSKMKTYGWIELPERSREVYQICDSGKVDTGKITLYQHNSPHLVHYNIDTDDYNKQNCDFNIWSCVRLFEDRYVGLEISTPGKVHLFDKRGKRQKTLVTTAGDDRALCYHSLNKFLKMNVEQSGKLCKVRLSLIKVSTGMFNFEQEMEVTTADKPDFISKHNGKDLISMISDRYLYTVNLKTSAIETHEISRFVDGRTIVGFYVDREENKIVGDSQDKLHLFDRKMNHSVIAEVDHEPWGITMQGDVLYVASYDFMFTYRVPRNESDEQMDTCKDG